MELIHVKPDLDFCVPFMFMLNEAFVALVRNWLIGFWFNKKYSSTFCANVFFSWFYYNGCIPTTEMHLTTVIISFFF